jgi:hypothetical protein
MRCTVHFYKLNYDFSPEFAEAHHEGKPSENNRLYDWEDELAVKSDIVSFKVIENQTFKLQGERGGEPFEEEVKNVMLFEFTDENDTATVMACSHSVVKEYKVEEEEETLKLAIFLEELEPLTNPIPGVYIAVQEFPKSLI